MIGGVLSLIVIFPGLTLWALHIADQPKQAALKQADAERVKAKQAEEKAKNQLKEAEAARQTAAAQRNQALAAARAARRSEQVNKAVLDFLQKKVFSSGNPKGWGATTLGKDVTLRQAVDAAEPRVADAFVDQPLVEASIRRILGVTYMDLGEAERALPQFERALTLWEAILGPDHPYSSECRNQLAVAYRRAGRIDEAGRLYYQNPLSSSYAASLSIQGSALLAAKRPTAAELKLRESLAIRRKIQPDDWTTFDARSMLGAALLDQKKYPEAEQLLLSGYEGMKQRQAKIPSQDSSHLTRALERLVKLYEAWGKQDKAAQWQKELKTAAAPKKH